jgi:hypothetical protein
VWLNLRHADTPAFTEAFRAVMEDALSACIAVADAKALFAAFLAAEVPFHQRLRDEPWSARAFIVRDPARTCCCSRGAAGRRSARVGVDVCRDVGGAVDDVGDHPLRPNPQRAETIAVPFQPRSRSALSLVTRARNSFSACSPETVRPASASAMPRRMEASNAGGTGSPSSSSAAFGTGRELLMRRV